MSHQELKATVDALSEDDRLWLAAYLMHVERRDSPEHKADLARLNREIDEGHYYTLEQFEKVHAALKAERL